MQRVRVELTTGDAVTCHEIDHWNHGIVLKDNDGSHMGFVADSMVGVIEHFEE